MQQKHNNKLIEKVLPTGAVIAILSYLFHPNVRQLSIFSTGSRFQSHWFAAGPTFQVQDVSNI